MNDGAQDVSWYVSASVDSEPLGFDYGRMIVSQSPYHTSNAFPPPNSSYALLAEDDTGDASSNQDIINLRGTYNDNNTYVSMGIDGGCCDAGGFFGPWYLYGVAIVNPEAEILVNLPTVARATETADVLISGDAAETIEAGRGSDVMMGRGGSDNYKINIGDTIETDENGVVVAGDYGVAGDVINEIGGSSEDKSDSITLSSAQSIDQLTFTRTEIKHEDFSNTLKIDVDYEKDGTVDDTLFVFDHYNQNLGFRSVEQLFLDDGWDSNEIWNLIVGDVNSLFVS